jgi:hypothetical protein
MGLNHSPSIVTSGLVFCVDPSNRKSYVVGGTTVSNLISPLNGTVINLIGYENNFLNFVAANSSFVQYPVSSSVNITNNITIDFWFNANTYVNVGGVVTFGTGGGEQYAIWTASTPPRLVFSTNWPGTWYQASTNTLSTNITYHAAVTFSSNTFIWYINGSQTNTGNLGANTLTSVSSSYLTIGNNHPGGQEYYNGRLGPVNIYNRVLTANEILQNFNAHRGRYGL